MATTKARSNTRELRREAKNLGIDGWEDMNIRQLKAAIKEAGGDTDPAPATAKKATTRKTAAKKTTAKKAPAKRAPADDDEDAELPENGNPFKAGTNLFLIAEEVIRGGKRSAMVTKLKRKIELKPRKNVDDFDEDAELDRRILIVGQLLRKDHGFEVVRDGRGADAKIKATQPE